MRFYSLDRGRERHSQRHKSFPIFRVHVRSRKPLALISLVQLEQLVGLVMPGSSSCHSWTLLSFKLTLLKNVQVSVVRYRRGQETGFCRWLYVIEFCSVYLLSLHQSQFNRVDQVHQSPNITHTRPPILSQFVKVKNDLRTYKSASFFFHTLSPLIKWDHRHHSHLHTQNASTASDSWSLLKHLHRGTHTPKIFEGLDAQPLHESNSILEQYTADRGEEFRGKRKALRAPRRK